MKFIELAAIKGGAATQVCHSFDSFRTVLARFGRFWEEFSSDFERLLLAFPLIFWTDFGLIWVALLVAAGAPDDADDRLRRG